MTIGILKFSEISLKFHQSYDAGDDILELFPLEMFKIAGFFFKFIPNNNNFSNVMLVIIIICH